MKCSIYPLMPTNVITYTDGWWRYVRKALVIIHVFLHHYNFGKERPISHGLYFVSDNSDLLAVRVVTSSNSVISIGHSSNSGSKTSRYAQHSNVIPIFFTLADFNTSCPTNSNYEIVEIIMSMLKWVKCERHGCFKPKSTLPRCRHLPNRSGGTRFKTVGMGSRHICRVAI